MTSPLPHQVCGQKMCIPVECVCVFKRKKDNFEHNVTIVLSCVLACTMVKSSYLGMHCVFLLLYSGNTIIFHFYNDTTMFLDLYHGNTLFCGCSTIIIWTIPILKLCFGDILPCHYLPVDFSTCTIAIQ